MQFVIKQRMLAIRDSFFITDVSGNRVLEVKGSLVKIPKRFAIKDVGGNDLLIVRHKLWHFFAHYDVETPEGDVIAKVNAKFSLIKPKFNIQTVEFGNLSIDGSLFSYSYRLLAEDGTVVAQTNKKVLAIRDAYVLDVQDPKIALLSVALAIVFDECNHGKKRNSFWS